MPRKVWNESRTILSIILTYKTCATIRYNVSLSSTKLKIRRATILLKIRWIRIMICALFSLFIREMNSIFNKKRNSLMDSPDYLKTSKRLCVTETKFRDEGWKIDREVHWHAQEQICHFKLFRCPFKYAPDRAQGVHGRNATKKPYGRSETREQTLFENINYRTKNIKYFRIFCCDW